MMIFRYLAYFSAYFKLLIYVIWVHFTSFETTKSLPWLLAAEWRYQTELQGLEKVVTAQLENRKPQYARTIAPYDGVY